MDKQMCNKIKLLQDAIISAQKIFDANATVAAAATLCSHELINHVCILCGQFLCDTFLSPVYIPLHAIPHEEFCFLPPMLDKRLVELAVDLFGCIYIAQIRTHKKKIILSTCLLYICSQRDIIYFYQNFRLLGVTAKEMMYGISMVETLLPPVKNKFYLDFKLHEMLLCLVEKNLTEHIKTILQLHPSLGDCYNKLRIKSILDACLYLIRPNNKPPPAVKPVRECIFLYSLPDRFVDIFSEEPVCSHKNPVRYIENTSVFILLTDAGLEIRAKTDFSLFNHRQATLAAWEALFESRFYHPDGAVYKAKRSVSEMFETFSPVSAKP